MRGGEKGERELSIRFLPTDSKKETGSGVAVRQLESSFVGGQLEQQLASNRRKKGFLPERDVKVDSGYFIHQLLKSG